MVSLTLNVILHVARKKKHSKYHGVAPYHAHYNQLYFELVSIEDYKMAVISFGQPSGMFGIIHV